MLTSCHYSMWYDDASSVTVKGVFPFVQSLVFAKKILVLFANKCKFNIETQVIVWSHG